MASNSSPNMHKNRSKLQILCNSKMYVSSYSDYFLIQCTRFFSFLLFCFVLFCCFLFIWCVHFLIIIINILQFIIPLFVSVIEMGLDYTRLLQDCYPEIWSHVLFVNGNVIFVTFYCYKNKKFNAWCKIW